MSKVKKYKPSEVYVLFKGDFSLFFVEYTLTEDKLKKKEGVISTFSSTIPLENVENVDFSSGVLEGFLNVGSVEVSDASENSIVLEGVRNPEKIKQEISSRVDTSHSTRSSGEGSISEDNKRRFLKVLQDMNNNFEDIKEEFE